MGERKLRQLVVQDGLLTAQVFGKRSEQSTSLASVSSSARPEINDEVNGVLHYVGKGGKDYPLHPSVREGTQALCYAIASNSLPAVRLLWSSGTPQACQPQSPLVKSSNGVAMRDWSSIMSPLAGWRVTLPIPGAA